MLNFVFRPTTLCLALSCAFLATSQAAAQSNTAETVPSVTITATPIIEETRINPFAGSASVLDAKQLRDLNAVDLASSLRSTPGVQIARFNPVGAFGGNEGGGVFIRGMGASRPGAEIKTYIDAVPFYMTLWNHPLLDLLPLNGMQEIVVHKSPQPQSSGNNFAAINLSSQRAKQEGLHGNGKLSVGGMNTVIEQANLLGKFGDTDFLISQGYAKSDGARPHAGGKLSNIFARLQHKLDANWALSVSALGTDNHAEDPGDARSNQAVPNTNYDTSYDTKASMLSAELSHQHGNWRGSLRLFSNRGDGDWLQQGAPEGDTLSHFQHQGLLWREEFTPWPQGKISAGLDIEKFKARAQFKRVAPAPQDDYSTPEFQLSMPWFAYQHSFALSQDWQLQPSFGVRLYRHNQFGSSSAPHLGVILRGPELSLFANLSRGVNYPGLEAPTLARLIPPLASSWSSLQPEKLNHAEIGLNYYPSRSTRIDVSLFQDQHRGRYIFGFPPDVTPPAFVNLGDYTMRGAELAVKQELGRHWTSFAAFTWLQADLAGLPYAPKHALTMGLNGQYDKWRIALDAQYQARVLVMNSARVAGAMNTESVNPFFSMNARLAYAIPAWGKQTEVFVAVENVLNKQYSYRPGYAMPGRWGQIGISSGF